MECSYEMKPGQKGTERKRSRADDARNKAVCVTKMKRKTKTKRSEQHQNRYAGVRV